MYFFQLAAISAKIQNVRYFYYSDRIYNVLNWTFQKCE